MGGVVSGLPVGKVTSASSILLTPSISTANSHTVVSSSSTTTTKGRILLNSQTVNK